MLSAASEWLSGIVVLRRSSMLTVGSTDGRYDPKIQDGILASKYDELAGRPGQKIAITRGGNAIDQKLVINYLQNPDR